MLRVPEAIRTLHNPDGGVVLDIRHGQMFTLNFIGSRIVNLLIQGYEEPRIVREISQEFRVDPDIVQIDVREFLDALEKNRLLEVRSAGGIA
jgi:hypothetical protein